MKIMIRQLSKLVFFSLLRISDAIIYVSLLTNLLSSSNNSALYYVIPALTLIGVSSIASFLHALYDAKQHRGLLPTLPGGVALWLPLSLFCSLPPMSTVSSLIFFLLRAFVGSVNRDFRSSLVVVSEDAADAQLCLHAYLQSAPLMALNILWAASSDRVSAPLLIATISSLLHVYAGIFMGRRTNLRLYFAWFFVDYDDDDGDGDAASSNTGVDKSTKNLRLFAALISVCFRFYCVSVVATTFASVAVFASHRHVSLMALTLLAFPHLFFLCFEVVWKLFAHRFLAFLQNERRRGIFLFLLILLCGTTTLLNALFSASWFIDVKRNDLELPSMHCRWTTGRTTSKLSKNLIGDNDNDSSNDYIRGVPAFIWPRTTSLFNALTTCVPRSSSSSSSPKWTHCSLQSLFGNGTLVETRHWWRRLDWSTDIGAAWRSDALFCLRHVAEPLFLCVFYANAGQVVVLFILLLACAAWKLIIVMRSTTNVDSTGTLGRETELAMKDLR